MSVSAKNDLESVFKVNSVKDIPEGSKVNVSLIHSGHIKRLNELPNLYQVEIKRSGTGMKVILIE